MEIKTNWVPGAIMLAAFTLFVLVMIVIFKVIVPFLQDKRFIEGEMERTDGETYRYWENELKKLYLSQIPLVGRGLAKKQTKK